MGMKKYADIINDSSRNYNKNVLYYFSNEKSSDSIS